MSDPSNPQSAARSNPAPRYTPPAFSQHDEAPPQIACASCPSAMWYHSGKWRCFCQQMKVATVGENIPKITVCDGREMALAQYRRALASGNAGR